MGRRGHSCGFEDPNRTHAPRTFSSPVNEWHLSNLYSGAVFKICNREEFLKVRCTSPFSLAVVMSKRGGNKKGLEGHKWERGRGRFS